MAGLLLGLVAAGGVIALMPPQYSAAVTVIVSAQPGDSATATSTGGDVSAQRMGTYVELMRSKRLAGGVISTLRLPVTPDDLSQRIKVSTTPDSLLLTAAVTDGSGDQAVALANAVGQQFIKSVTEIEQPSDPARPPTVTAKVFESAQPPAELVAPKPLAYLIIGAAIGLALGFTVAVLRHKFDSRIRSRRQLEAILGAPVLGIIGRDRKLATSPLVMYGAPDTPPAEAFRQLRTNVLFADVDREHLMILVTSATAGEGRSTTVCNLGLAMAEAGIKVLIVDADLRTPTVATVLKIENEVGLTDLLADRLPLEQVLQGVSLDLDVLASGPLPPNPSELLGSGRMSRLLSRLRDTYDVVLIDTSPLLPVTDAAVLAPQADGVLVVVGHGKVRAEDVQAARETLDGVTARILGSVMTMVPDAGKQSRGRAGPRNGSRSPKPVRAAPIINGQVNSNNGGAGVAAPAADPDRQENLPSPRRPESIDADGRALDGGGRTSR